MRFACLLILFFIYNINFGQKDTLSYVFIGHPYWWEDSKKIDPRIEKMDTNEFDGIWFGGDVISEAGLYYSNFEYLDSLYDLSKPSNHWTLGNHDSRNGNLEWYSEFTKRPTYYSHSTEGLTVIVMDGNISPLDCENLDKQYEMIKNVCDTISKGYLVFLIHHGITIDVPGIPSPSSYGHTALKNWMAYCDNDSSTYAKSIYPMLVEVEEKGIEVMHVMGDVGANKKYFHGISDDGIDYFGSGINNSYNILKDIPIVNPDLVLLFKHIPKENKMLWEFIEVNSLKQYPN
tara:strand:- start:27 stop:893 length:867 start_codon:yes stop_codon:yes gene_type:complete